MGCGISSPRGTGRSQVSNLGLTEPAVLAHFKSDEATATTSNGRIEEVQAEPGTVHAHTESRTLDATPSKLASMSTSLLMNVANVELLNALHAIDASASGLAGGLAEVVDTLIGHNVDKLALLSNHPVGPPKLTLSQRSGSPLRLRSVPKHVAQEIGFHPDVLPVPDRSDTSASILGHGSSSSSEHSAAPIQPLRVLQVDVGDLLLAAKTMRCIVQNIQEIARFATGDSTKPATGPLWLRQALQLVVQDFCDVGDSFGVELSLQVAPNVPDHVILDGHVVKTVLLDALSIALKYALRRKQPVAASGVDGATSIPSLTPDRGAKISVVCSLVHGSVSSPGGLVPAVEAPGGAAPEAQKGSSRLLFEVIDGGHGLSGYSCAQLMTAIEERRPVMCTRALRYALLLPVSRLMCTHCGGEAGIEDVQVPVVQGQAGAITGQRTVRFWITMPCISAPDKRDFERADVLLMDSRLGGTAEGEDRTGNGSVGLPKLATREKRVFSDKELPASADTGSTLEIESGALRQCLPGQIDGDVYPTTVRSKGSDTPAGRPEVDAAGRGLSVYSDAYALVQEPSPTYHAHSAQEHRARAYSSSSSTFTSRQRDNTAIRHGYNGMMMNASVLLVDDSKPIRKQAEQFLDSLGCSCTSIEDGDEVEAALAAATHPFDVIFMDISMHRMNGDMATKALRAAGARCPIIAMTASAFPSDRATYLAAGFDLVLPKPFTRDSMGAILLEVTAEQRRLVGEAGAGAGSMMRSPREVEPMLGPRGIEDFGIRLPQADRQELVDRTQRQ